MKRAKFNPSSAKFELFMIIQAHFSNSQTDVVSSTKFNQSKVKSAGQVQTALN